MTSLPITPTNPDHSICQRIQIWIHYESESRFGKSNTALEQLWQTPPPACVGDPAFSEDRPLLTLCLLARSQRPVCVKTRQTGPVGKGGLTQTWMVWLVIPPHKYQWHILHSFTHVCQCHCHFTTCIYVIDDVVTLGTLLNPGLYCRPGVY